MTLCLSLGQMQRRQVAFVAQRMGQWEPIIDHTHPPIYTSDTNATHPPLYSREVTLLITGGGSQMGCQTHGWPAFDVAANDGGIKRAAKGKYRDQNCS